MPRRLPVGIEFYKEMIDKNYCYVDKTLLIRDILDAGAKISLFTRPRRFGKTLALSMLKAFFEDERDGDGDGNKIDNSRYFEGKRISDCGEKYRSEQGKYPVINLTLKSAKQPNYEKPYWSNTSSNSIIRELVEKADRNTRSEIEQLIAGGTIEKPVHEDITYGDIRESQDNLWNFLFFTGYLKKAGERFEEDRSYLTLAVPNREIRCIYRDTILSWFDKRIKAADRMPFYRALLAGECDVIERELNGQLVKSISFYDAAEQFYHGFMAGMLGGLGEYRLYSNREAGDGRPDLMLTPEDWREPVMIFELKKADKFTQLEAGCEAALAQIEERHYDAEYKEEGYERFIKYGICFCGKACRVKVVMESAERE